MPTKPPPGDPQEYSGRGRPPGSKPGRKTKPKPPPPPYDFIKDIQQRAKAWRDAEVVDDPGPSRLAGQLAEALRKKDPESARKR